MSSSASTIIFLFFLMLSIIELFNIKLFKINNKLKFLHNHTCQSKLLSNFIFLYFSIHMLNILSENGRQCKFSFSRLLLIYIRYLSMSEHLYIAHFYHDYTSGIYSCLLCDILYRIPYFRLSFPVCGKINNDLFRH